MKELENLPSIPYKITKLDISGKIHRIPLISTVSGDLLATGTKGIRSQRLKIL